MLATFGMVSDALVMTNPYVSPGCLVIGGLAACLWASVRRRLWWTRGGRAVVAAYLVLATLCFTYAGGVLAYRAQMFWGVRIENSDVVLERLGPLSDLRIPKSTIRAITEFSAPERHLGGSRVAVQFIVYTRDGDSFWSAPLYHRGEAESARHALVAAGTRLESFSIGRRVLPD